jgi:hypothetical protein
LFENHFVQLPTVNRIKQTVTKCLKVNPKNKHELVLHKSLLFCYANESRRYTAEFLSTLEIVNLSPIGLTCHRVNWNHSHQMNAREFIRRVVVVHDIVAAAAVQVGVRYEPGETL